MAGDTDSERDRQLSTVTELASYAAEQTLLARRGDIGAVATKRDAADLVTDVDRRVEREVRRVLYDRFPDHDVVGEEYGGTTSGDRPCWYLDPIDGTTNLACGIPWTSFSLALVEQGRPVVAAVLDPIGSALAPEAPREEGAPGPVAIVAAEGRGAWRLGRRITVQARHPLADDPLSGDVVATELLAARPWPGLHTLMDSLADRHCTLRIQGSGTATLAGIALGRGAAAVIGHYSHIDHAAAILIVAEAGGTVLDESGASTLTLDGGAVFAGRDERAARALWSAWRDAAQASQ